MPDLRILTSRLELVAGTVRLAQAEIDDLPGLAHLLDTPTPASDVGWNLWFCVRRKPRELIGNAGFKGSPKDGLVEIGYSMLEMHQRQRYATETVSSRLGISEPRGTKGCCRYSTGADAVHSCDGKIRGRVCRQWAPRGWYADDSLRIDAGSIGSAALESKFARRKTANRDM